MSVTGEEVRVTADTNPVWINSFLITSAFLLASSDEGIEIRLLGLYPRSLPFTCWICWYTRIVDDINKTEILNCRTTNTSRGIAAFFPARKVPFNTLTGLKEDRYKAG